MSRVEGLTFTPVEARKKRDIEHGLRHLEIDGPSGFVGIRSTLGEFLAVESPQAHAFDEVGDSIQVAFLHTDLRGDVRSTLNMSLAATGGVGWAHFDLLAPELAQRNRARRLTVAELRSTHAYTAGCRHGAAEMHQLRVLICEGASLLAWVGGYREHAFGPRDAKLLDSLVPSLRRRFALERQLETSARTRRTLDVTLELIGRAAYVVAQRRARIVHVNRAGWQRLQQDRAARIAEILAATSGADPSFDVHPLTSAGAPPEFLVIEREQSTLNARARLAAARWALSPRQAEVLGLVATGLSNAAIAAALRISIRTVEVHVTAIFDRAGCDSRASLIATLWE